MPLYDYRCRECGHKFEAIRSNEEKDTGVECPACGSKAPLRLISLFSGGGKSSGGYPRRFG